MEEIKKKKDRQRKMTLDELQYGVKKLSNVEGYCKVQVCLNPNINFENTHLIRNHYEVRWVVW